MSQRLRSALPVVFAVAGLAAISASLLLDAAPTPLMASERR